ncbi:MAG: glucuronate isomerase [Pseudomonadales bacterium]
MNNALILHEDRLFSSNADERSIARTLYEGVKDLPIISPHGHTDPEWFSSNEAFSDPVSLLIQPDHYLLRVLYSRGIQMEALGISGIDGSQTATDMRSIWRLFAENYDLFLGTPSRIWLNHTFATVFDIKERLSADTADASFDRISECLAQPAFRPRALFDQFNISLLATTESPLDDLSHHDTINKSDWSGRIITTYRPDPVVDPEYEGFSENVAELGQLTGEDTSNWQGYLQAHRIRREYFKARGATSTDHGHPAATTCDLDLAECEKLYEKVRSGKANAKESDQFRGQMLVEMAAMSIEDGLVMQIHPGVYRNHNPILFRGYGRDKGADIPVAADFVHALKPLLDRFGNDRRLSLILFTLDETSYSRELAPLAGHYPCLTLGPAWWFFDSPEGMLRYKRTVIETTGFYNTAGFNDDTRAFLSIPARHDVARRIDCRHLAELVCDHRIAEDEAVELSRQLANGLAIEAYRLKLSDV